LRFASLIAALASEAYERKKQRAKEGRIKLNESIEQLAIAISNAQATCIGHMKASEHLAIVNSDLSLFTQSSPIVQQANRVTEVASKAKKWDRPTFIGIAAELIHTLNDQCDTLYHDIYNLKQHQQHLKSSLPATPASAASNPLAKPSNSSKRQRTATENEATLPQASYGPAGTFSPLLSCTSAFQNLVYFLTPACLTNMRKLGRTFRYASALQSDQTYRQLSIVRFGSKIKTSNIGRISIPWIDKYKLLVSRDTLPFSEFFPNPMGSSRKWSSMSPSLSASNFPSAWVSLVTRSNGETNRAVLQADQQYKAMPIVLLRVLIQNTTAKQITIRDQLITVEVHSSFCPSFIEVRSDPRLGKSYFSLSGKVYNKVQPDRSIVLKIFESVILQVHVHATNCGNEAKFHVAAKKMSLMLDVDGEQTNVDIELDGHARNKMKSR